MMMLNTGSLYKHPEPLTAAPSGEGRGSLGIRNVKKLSSSLDRFFFKLYVYERFACIFVCASHVCLVLEGVKRGHQIPWICELPCGCLDQNPGLWESSQCS